LRSKMFLNMMTRPNIRASEYKRGLKGLTDDILAKAKADGVTIEIVRTRPSTFFSIFFSIKFIFNADKYLITI